MNTTPPVTEPEPPAGRSRLWLFFVAVIALQLAAWTVWFIIAARHPVAEVPVVTAPRR